MARTEIKKAARTVQQNTFENAKSLPLMILSLLTLELMIWTWQSPTDSAVLVLRFHIGRKPRLFRFNRTPGARVAPQNQPMKAGGEKHFVRGREDAVVFLKMKASLSLSRDLREDIEGRLQQVSTLLQAKELGWHRKVRRSTGCIS
jgi:hypothetical protein